MPPSWAANAEGFCSPNFGLCSFQCPYNPQAMLRPLRRLVSSGSASLLSNQQLLVLQPDFPAFAQVLLRTEFALVCSSLSFRTPPWSNTVAPSFKHEMFLLLSRLLEIPVWDFISICENITCHSGQWILQSCYIMTAWKNFLMETWEQ